MSRLLNMLQAARTIRPSTLALYVLVAIIALQSTFVAAQMCSSNENNGYYSELSFKTNTLLYEDAAIKDQQNTIEECFDCDCKCCPCCSNVMFALAALKSSYKKPDSIQFYFEFSRFSTPYYSFLRPPKS